jgi:hypothetical protein
MGNSHNLQLFGDVFHPTLRSFVVSTIYDMPILLVSALGTYFFANSSNKTVFIIMNACAILFFLYSFSTTIVAHSLKIAIGNEGIAIAGPTCRPFGLRWDDMETAVVRERHNFISGKDVLLIINPHSPRKLSYAISVLSKINQDKILYSVRQTVPIRIIHDKPTI